MVVALGFLQQTLALIPLTDILRPATLSAGLSVALFAGAASPLPLDTLRLGGVEVRAAGPSAPVVRRDGSILFTRSALDRTVRTMGEADMLRLVSLAGGTSSPSDYASGPTVDGASWANNTVIAGGVPVIFPYHFGGIYSALNSAIYPRATLYKSIHPASHPDVIGAVTMLEPALLTDATEIEVNAGMTASGVAVNIPASPRLTIGAAARASYITLLYGDMLGGRSTDIGYNFQDVDLHTLWTPDPSNTVSATFHHNGDRLDYNDNNYGMLTRLHWRNWGAHIGWRHEGRSLSIAQSVSVTSLDNRLTLDITDVAVRVPASTLTASAEGQIGPVQDRSRRLSWLSGYSAAFNSFMPQSASVAGIGEDIAGRRPRNSSGSGRIWGSLRLRMSETVSATAALALTAYGSGDGYFTFLPSPRLTVDLASPSGLSATLHAGRYVQCVHYLGLSEIGLSSNFRLGASHAVPPQSAWNFAMSLSRTFRQAGISVSADAYYRIVQRDAEYAGTVLDLLDNAYLAENHVTVTHGYNTGASLTVRGLRSRVGWWLAYAFGTARRRYPGVAGWINASTDMGHSLTANASWPIGAHWTISGLFSLASGRPYTPVEAIYIIGERVIAQYARRNSGRFPLYHRLDLGVTYSFRTRGRFPLSHSVNLSLLNVYGRSNVELQSWNVNITTGRYYLRQISSLYRFMPSLSYTIKFSSTPR